MKTCLAVPTINELSNLKVLLPSLRQTFPDSTILIIDDGSSDGTRQFLDKLMASDRKMNAIYRHKKLGIGSAHLIALEYASKNEFEYLLTLDGDLTHSPKDALKLLIYVGEHDLVVGSRFVSAGGMSDWSIFRRILTRGAHFVTKIAFASEIDMSSALRIYKLSSVPLANLKASCGSSYDFFFQSILVYLELGKKINQIPVILESRGNGVSKMNLGLGLRNIFTLFLFAIKIKNIK